MPWTKEQRQAAMQSPERKKRHAAQEKARVARMTPEQREARREYNRKYHKTYHIKNAERRSQKAAERYAKNKEHILAVNAVWAANNRTRICENNRKREKKLRKTNPVFRVARNTKVRIYRALKIAGIDKTKRTKELMGCSPEEYAAKLEAQFKPGFSWDNHGTLWEIDHKRPVSRFNLLDGEQLKQCFHFSNVRPLEKYLNRAKGAKWEAS